MSGNTPNVPLEFNGGVPANLQDQTTRSIIVKFNEVQNSSTLDIPAVKGAYTIKPVSTTGFVDGRYIILFDPASVNFSFYRQIGAPAAGVVTLDTPIDFAYPEGTFIDAAITDMSVNGSGTPRVFGLRGTGAPPGVDITVDITSITIQCMTVTAVSLVEFGDLTALERGLVLRKRNNVIENIFNVKSNNELSGIMQFEPIVASNPGQGIDGFRAELIFAGQENIGVAIRLPIGEDLEVLNQDLLTGLTILEITAKGHILQN
jgi:hypothetical protein